MAAVAAFADSESGRSYLALCDRFHVDPAAGITDDVVAVNLRAALVMSTVEEAEPSTELEAEWLRLGEEALPA